MMKENASQCKCSCSVVFFICHGSVVFSSNDGALLAVGGTAGVLRIWDYCSRTQLNAQKIHSAQINAVSFSPDDKQVVSVGEDGSIVVWYIF
jgi:WD40 repeat protein